MRVISGSARGLKLSSPDGLYTRPTTDRVKESIFNIIQTYIPCNNVLDLFAGSGALGIEALSRSSSRCTFVENNLQSFSTVKANIKKARLTEKAELVMKDAFDFLNSCTKKFDIIFLDPPYNMGLLKKSFDYIYKQNILSENGIIVVETEFNGEIPENNNFECVKNAKYGKTLVLIYKLK